MLYLPGNNGETCKEQLCQHPQCWRTNVRRAREAVRKRNGITEKEAGRPRRRHYSQDQPKVSFDQSKVYSLPTLKVVDVMQDIVTPYSAETPCRGYGGDDCDGHDTGPSVPIIHYQKQETPATSISSPRSRLPCGTSFSTYAPHTTPVSPVASDVKKPTSAKPHKHAQSEQLLDEKSVKKIQFHEIYDYKEVCEDWQETFISSAYLVWCPSRKKRRNLRIRSATTDDRKKGFRNIVDEVLPLPIENTKKKSRSYRCPPTGGQPYSPCRSPLMKQELYKQTYGNSNGEFILTTTSVEIPESLVAKKKILEPKTNGRAQDQRFELGSTSSTKVLVDISSQLSLNTVRTTIDEAKKTNQRSEINQEQELGRGMPCDNEPTKHDDDDSKKSNTEIKMPEKQPTEFKSRRILPLPSIGVPWGLIPEQQDGHCRNSIPNDVDLGVIMEPVVYLPRSASLSCQDTSNTYEELQTRDMVNMAGLIDNVDQRDHLTSAYRFSPKYVFAPAPTPITPRTRESMRRKASDVAAPHTYRSFIRSSVAEGGTPLIPYDDVGKKFPERQRTRIADDHVIHEVRETNRYGEPGLELLPEGAVVMQTNEVGAQGKNLHDKSYELDSSFRAISPSSRTNIPPDIWAELHGEMMRDTRSAVRCDFSDALASPAVYSYCESSWKPSATKLPQSFASKRTYVGPYSTTILPQMPASLTVVPVPSIARVSCTTVKQRDREYPQTRQEPPGIIMPPVPAGSPVPSETLQPPSSPALKHTSETGIPCASINLENKPRPLVKDVASEETGYKESGDDNGETGIEEYLVARDVMSEHDVCVNEMQSRSDVILTNVISANAKDVCVSDATRSVEILETASDEKPSDIAQSSSNAVHNVRDKESFASSSETVDQTVVKDSSEHEISSEQKEDVMLERITDAAEVNTLNSETVCTEQLEQHLPSASTDVYQYSSSTVKLGNDRVPSDFSVDESDHDVPQESVIHEQESGESLTSLNDIQPEISNESILSKVSSDFQLEPFNVESTLLQPIAIESDLLLLTDSFLDISFDDDNVGNQD